MRAGPGSAAAAGPSIKPGPPPSPRVDVRQEVVQKIIAAMKEGNTPWQRPWSAVSMKAINGVTDNAYRGINRLLLSLAGEAYSDPRWLTFKQAAANGWMVKKGSKGQMIVKVVDLDRDPASPGQGGQADRGDGQRAGDHRSEGKSGAQGEQSEGSPPKRIALKRYFVFNAEQIEGIPPLPEPEGQPEFDPVDKAEAIFKALKEQTGLLVVHGGNKACYIPATDEIRLPKKSAFASSADLWSVSLHEAAHCTLSEKRLDRRDALGQRWGDEAYAMEELRAELCSAITSAETGVYASPEMAATHIAKHASYLASWIKVLEKDPMALFSAARDADKMATYLVDLGREHTAMATHKEWVAEYDATQEAGQRR
ncbi:MAG: DUF1738 domain-containing protein [Betaproteobacteria bacterium]|nr:DUF1738 domain-containing protein [Betaproteobacteria bacterium]